MRKQVHELRNNRRVQALRGKNAAPQERTSGRVKSFSLRVECAADHPHRIAKLENLNDELLQKHLYTAMKPVSIMCVGMAGQVSEEFSKSDKTSDKTPDKVVFITISEADRRYINDTKMKQNREMRLHDIITNYRDAHPEEEP